jgi:hypothetical protein
MLAILEFIFSSFWIWLGTLVMGTSFLAAFSAFRLFTVKTTKVTDKKPNEETN